MYNYKNFINTFLFTFHDNFLKLPFAYRKRKISNHIYKK